ncbi:MAG: transcription elongation factor Spt5 [Nanoarchaeota archaeon]
MAEENNEQEEGTKKHPKKAEKQEDHFAAEEFKDVKGDEEDQEETKDTKHLEQIKKELVVEHSADEDEFEDEKAFFTKEKKAEPKEKHPEEETEEEKEIEEEKPKQKKERRKKEKRETREGFEKEEKEMAAEEERKSAPEGMTTKIFGLRTTANREDQVMSFVSSNVVRKKIPVYSIVRPHGMRGYIFIEADNMTDAEAAAFGVPYARGILPQEIKYKEIEHMLERIKKEVNIQKNDIAEIISGPFKREKAKIVRVDKAKEEVVVELLEAAVPIPITVKMDAVKVIRRDTKEEERD